MEVLSPARTAATPASAVRPLLLVVGYDGSMPARHALNEAADLLRDRQGALEIVYVAHPPMATEIVPEAMAAAMQGLDVQAGALREEVEDRLRGERHRWHFHRRVGSIPAELMAVANVLQRRYGAEAEVAIVVGGSAHRYHHLAGSVGASVARADRFPVLVVP
jgi:nucleotide-binding universal stress UspA family protein